MPIALHSLKDRYRDRPTAAQLCQRLEQLKASQAYAVSVAENTLEQQLKLREKEKAAEIAWLQEQMRQLTTEKEQQQKMKEREVAELRHQLQTSMTASVQKTLVRNHSKSEVSVIIIIINSMGDQMFMSPNYVV